MDNFYKNIRHLFHPILMPLIGAIIYFCTTPRFTPFNVMIANSLSLLILTVLTPIVLLYFLKNLGLIENVRNLKTKELKLPLLLYICLLSLVIKMVLAADKFPEIYYFFTAILFSTLFTLLLTLYNKKTSLHLIGISQVTTFTIGLSIHFSIYLIPVIALLVFFTGLLATACLQQRKNNVTQIISGFIIGISSQLFLFTLWLF